MFGSSLVLVAVADLRGRVLGCCSQIAPVQGATFVIVLPMAFGSREHPVLKSTRSREDIALQCLAGGGAAIDIVGGFRVERKSGLRAAHP